MDGKKPPEHEQPQHQQQQPPQHQQQQKGGQQPPEPPGPATPAWAKYALKVSPDEIEKIHESEVELQAKSKHDVLIKSAGDIDRTALQQPQPRLTGPITVALTNSSATFGRAWYDFTLNAAAAAGTLSVSLPTQGGGQHMQELNQLFMCAAVAPGLTIAQAGLPGSQPGLPSGMGFGPVTITPASPPTNPNATLNITLTGSGTVPLGTRFLIFTATGV